MTGGRGARGAVPALVVAVLALTGCSGDGGDGADGQGAPGGTPASASGSPGLPQVTVDPSEAAADTAAPKSVGEFCAPYVEMRRTIEGIDYGAADDEIAAQLAPEMRAWAAQVPRLTRPPGIADEVWDGLQLLARRIRALPETPTLDQIEAVEDDLTKADRRLISAASDWFATNCALEPSAADSP